MSFHMRKLLIAAILVVTTAAAAPPHPTDASMIATFRSHEADFDSLVAMLDSDRKLLPADALPMGLDGLEAAGVDTARVDVYKSILLRIGATSFRFFPKFGNISLMVWALGLGPSGSTKSFFYVASGTAYHMVDDTDHYTPKPDENYIDISRRIKGNWFIHFDAT
jgi:hypothetical protein